jgi:serine/threonine-protein kinase
VNYWANKRKFMAELDGAGSEDSQLLDNCSGQCLDGRFLLQELLATGGFAEVYRAADLANASEPVAVKLLHPLRDHAEWRRRRFRQEVAALQKLDHKGIVRIRHAGEASAVRPYVVMEFIDGITLRSLLSDGPLEWHRAANLLNQIGEALATAHQAGILHRDLKPENVMVLDAGLPSEKTKLIDFGIANTEIDEVRTQTTQLAGSPGYVAPERWLGRQSRASDIFSLAAVATEMLTGSPTPDRLDSLPPNLAELLSAGVAYDPAKRPTDAAVFAAELSRCCAREL